jgi:hypothetical protein
MRDSEDQFGSSFKTTYAFAKNEVLLALTMVTVMVWYVTPYSWVEIYVCFREIYYLKIQHSI